MVYPIKSLSQYCIGAIETEIGEQFHNAPFVDTAEMRRVSRKVFEIFSELQESKVTAEQFSAAILPIFFSTSFSLSRKTASHFKEVFKWLSVMIEFSDPDTYAHHPFLKINRLVTAKVYYVGMQILLMSVKAASSYVSFPCQRRSILIEQRQCIVNLIKPPVNAPLYALEFFIEMEIEELQLLHLRNRAVPLFEDASLLRAVFEKKINFFDKYSEILNTKPLAVALAIETGQLDYRDVKGELSSLRSVAFASVTKDGHILALLSNRFKSDKELVLAAVRSRGLALEHAPLIFRNDPEIVSAAVLNCAGAFMFADLLLCSDQAFVLNIVGQKAMALEFATLELKDDFKVVMRAVMSQGGALQFASLRLRSDREIAMTAVRNQGFALRYVSKELQSDEEVVFAAVSNFGNALHFASPELRANSRCVTAAIQSNGQALEFAHHRFCSDRNLVWLAVQSQGNALQFASDTLRADRQIAMAAVKNNVDALEFVSSKLCDDEDLLALAIDQDAYLAIRCASQRLQNDVRFMAKAERLALTQEKIWDLWAMYLPGREWEYGI